MQSVETSNAFSRDPSPRPSDAPGVAPGWESIRTHSDFHTFTAEPHLARRRRLLNEKGEQIRALMGHHPRSALWIVGIVAIQFTLAYLLRAQSLWLVIPMAWIVGAFFNHALYVFIHEVSHNLVLSTGVGNRIMGMICDMPLLLPASTSFRKYHLLHHTRMGHYEVDSDLVSPFEAKLVGNGTIRKTIWVLLLGISQAMRPTRIAHPKLWDRWLVLNFAVQAVVVPAVIYFMGWTSVIYLLASSVFGLGLHPLGGRWLAEHYLTHDLDEKASPIAADGSVQETFSYYGPMNKVIFNVGYHQEHHDFMTIPWVNLPKLRALFEDDYLSLRYYRSYSRVLVDFLVDPRMHLKKRMTRSVPPATSAAS